MKGTDCGHGESSIVVRVGKCGCHEQSKSTFQSATSAMSGDVRDSGRVVCETVVGTRGVLIMITLITLYEGE